MTFEEHEQLSLGEKEHFYRCPECGQFIDKRELREVIFHEANHRPKRYIPRIIGKPISKRLFRR
jgi:hypothetical protein